MRRIWPHTLISWSRLLAGRLVADGGETIPATRLVTGYFAQEQLEQLRPADSPADHFRHAFELHDEQLLRDFLGGFGFVVVLFMAFRVLYRIILQLT